ncbi:hypothetical protein PRZ48_014286 [Zasmidium cellare]|uniref:3'(2'),5'-bisphosphate nucleotidase n=1 Tax=Zasmidium cellare TaxID=395010 RepID=A0ABR0E0J0_ZASCE|nr:hypothetical protein PRZ48_014286 [Zasmidium cellare]
MPSKFQAELDVACAAVQHCAVLTKRLQRETVSQDDQVKKSDFSPVTVGDFAAQALLTSATHGAFKDDKFLAEESADELRENDALLESVWQLTQELKPAFERSSPALITPTSKQEVCDLIDLGGKNEVSNDGRMWVFDPIDGTATFLRGQQYAINCAFLIDGIEQIGIIGCPNVILDSDSVHEDQVDKDLGCMIFAVRGEGTWVRPMRSDGVLAEAKKVDRHGEKVKIDDLIWSDCSTYTSTIQHLHQQVASKLYTPFPGVDLWDHAGGVLIFEEAGGRVTDLNGNSIDFTQGRKMAANYGLVCAPSSVHAEVLNKVQETLKAYEDTNGPIPYSK